MAFPFWNLTRGQGLVTCPSVRNMTGQTKVLPPFPFPITKFLLGKPLVFTAATAYRVPVTRSPCASISLLSDVQAFLL